jgi:hypothetical protein
VTDIRIVRDYPQSPAAVWRAVTDPALIPRWTRFRYEHAGFTGIGGFFLAALLGRVRRRMLTRGLPAVLDDLDSGGARRAGTIAG